MFCIHHLQQKQEKVACLKNKQKRIQERLVDLKITRLRQQLSVENFNLSDQNCNFLINPNICTKNKFIALQVRAKPTVGLYEDIDFVVTIFIEDYDYYKPPKIYNDRRIFHPNIDPRTIEIVIPELINWNPTNTIIYVLKRLKYTLIQPNANIIPNNLICRKAAYLYTIDRQNFRTYVVQYSPSVIENIVLKNIQNLQSQMKQQKQQKKYISVGQILPISRLKQYQQNSKIEDTFEFLNKRLSKIKIDSESQNEQMNIIFHYPHHEQSCFMYQQ